MSYLVSLSGEAISEMSQIREKFEMTKLLIEEVSRHKQKKKSKASIWENSDLRLKLFVLN